MRAVATTVGYAVVDTAIGPLLLAATDVGLVRVAFAAEDHPAVLADLAARVAGGRAERVRPDPERLAPAIRALLEYLDGSRRRFDLPLDRRLTRGFRREVLDHLTEIPYGARESYGQVAAAIGHPGAARAVGSACATNPLPVVVPCHRVVRSGGALGGYGGGTEVKRALLALESGH